MDRQSLDFAFFFPSPAGNFFLSSLSGERCRKCSGAHHDPDCAMSFFVLFLASPFFPQLKLAGSNPPLCLFSITAEPCRIVGKEPILETSALQ